MTLRLLTFFSLLATVTTASSIKGTIAITRAQGSHGSADLSGTVVWLEPLSEVVSIPHRTVERLRIVQKNKTFSPHVLAIPVGTSVDFPNFDPIFHNAFSNYNGQIFDIGLYPPGSSRSVVFHRAGVVRVFCNIHSTMSAVIVVLRYPFYTVSKADGSFQIDDVPEGSYRMQFYYERATEQMLASLAKTVEVRAPVEQAGTVRISETGYLPIPHLNKYGKTYGSVGDATTYPGARQ